MGRRNIEKRNFMYYGDWSVFNGIDRLLPSEIPGDMLTHLSIAFLDFDREGNLKWINRNAMINDSCKVDGVSFGEANAGLVNAFNNVRINNPNLKIGISIGGWVHSNNFSYMANSDTYRKNFSRNIAKFLEYSNMDFVDIDWEYPGCTRDEYFSSEEARKKRNNEALRDKENFILLLREIKNVLNNEEIKLGKKYELSVAISPSISNIERGIDVLNLFSIVDFVNLMTYDMRGAWDNITGHHTALYTNPNDPLKGRGLSVDEGVRNLINKGAVKDKILIGCGFYTRGWERALGEIDSKNPGLFGEAEIVAYDKKGNEIRGAKDQWTLNDGSRNGVWTYKNIEKLKEEYKGLQEYLDNIACAPYLYSRETGAFFTYENQRSVNEKTNYVNKEKLGGIVSWMASNDKITSTLKRDELTKVIKNGLFKDEKLKEREIIYRKINITSIINIVKEEKTLGNSYEITIKNNEVLVETNEVLSDLEKISKTIKNPKIYIKFNKENNYIVVDISKLESGRFIKPGGSYSFKLTSASKNISEKDIKTIEITQRIYSHGLELYNQTIYKAI